MNRALLATVLGAAVLVCSGCKAKQDDKAAIRAGVVRYLTSLNMLNLNAMDIDVTQATVNGNQAQAQVEIRAKDGQPGNSMQLTYSLEKRGDEWFVVKSQSSGGSMQHPAPGTMPPGHPGSSGQGDVHNFSDIIRSAQPPAQQQQPQTQQPQQQNPSQPAPNTKP